MMKNQIQNPKLLIALCAITTAITFSTCWASGPATDGKDVSNEQLDLPNIIVIFIDDMGYADIGPFGAKDYPTPNLDEMASQGRKFTDFVTTSAVCSASRSSLVTGCYHRRIGISGAFGPKAKRGINAEEMTIAELVKQKGYATACIGKWHLGHHKKFLPLQHGFDEYFGLPYSNDMWPYHPGYAHLPTLDEKRKQGYPDLPLIEGNETINPMMTGQDQAELTTQYTEKTIDFIRRNKDNPFLVYLPHTMVHVPLYVSEKFKGKSDRGLFGDVVMELDWSVGQIVKTLRELDLEKNTLMVFTSDNGPWLSYGDHAGSAKPLREGKGTMWEGGYRVPTIMKWPGKIPAGTTCDELSSTIDLLPTIAKLTGADLPNHEIDGKDIRPLMFGEQGAKSPHEAFYLYYGGGQLQGVRDRRWKLVFPHRYRTMDGKPGGTDGTPNPYSHKTSELELYDLKSDIGETKNLVKEHPEIVKRLQQNAENARADLGDKLTNRKGNGIRPAGTIEE